MDIKGTFIERRRKGNGGSPPSPWPYTTVEGGKGMRGTDAAEWAYRTLLLLAAGLIIWFLQAQYTRVNILAEKLPAVEATQTQMLMIIRDQQAELKEQRRILQEWIQNQPRGKR